jgi:hypothetical protein
MESLVLFGSQIGFIIALVALFIAFIVADVYENGYSATICALVFVGLNYFWGNLVWLSIFTWTTVGSYLFVGFLFSLVRTYFKGKEFNVTQKNGVGDVNFYNSRGETKASFELKENVFRWWFLFPISALTWVFGHLFVDLWNFIYAKVEGIYNRLFYGKK